MEELAKAEFEDNSHLPATPRQWFSSSVGTRSGTRFAPNMGSHVLPTTTKPSCGVRVLNSTRRDFLTAAGGLLISTAASVGSLFLVA